jgi:hypothetical protein
VSAHRCDLLKQGAHVLGVAWRERPTRMAGRKLGVANGGHTLTPHHVGGVTEDRQLALTGLREGLVSSPLQSVVAPSRGKPSRHGWVGGVSRNVHMDLTMPQPELTVRAAMVREKLRVAKVVQHVPE